MVLKEEGIISLMAKILSEKGEIVRLNYQQKNTIKIDGENFQPDLVTLDKDGQVTSIYEILMSVNQESILKLKEISEKIPVFLIVPDRKKEEAKKIVESNNIKIKLIYTFKENSN